MKYTININQKFCLQQGLTLHQGCLLDLLTQLSTWADARTFEDKEVYYSLAYEKVITELPLVFGKKDTVYKAISVLKKKGFVEQKKVGRIQQNFIRLTSLGKRISRVGNKSEPSQGSEINPRRVGNKSEPQKQAVGLTNTTSVLQGSDLNPNILYISYTKDNIYKKGPYFFLMQNAQFSLEALQMNHKKNIKDWDQLVINFCSKVDEEEMEYNAKRLINRLNRLCTNWRSFQSNNQNKEFNAPGPKLDRIG